MRNREQNLAFSERRDLVFDVAVRQPGIQCNLKHIGTVRRALDKAFGAAQNVRLVTFCVDLHKIDHRDGVENIIKPPQLHFGAFFVRRRRCEPGTGC